MKKRKRLLRVVKPLLLIGLGLMVGIILVESNSSTVEIHHDFDHRDFHIEQEIDIEMERMERELEQMMSELESQIEIEIPAIPPIPEIPEMRSEHVQKIVIEEHGHRSNGGFRLDASETVGIVAGIGIAMLILMSMVLIFDEIRGRRRA